MLDGHAQAWREWREALASARMHHAWILAGPEGMGKAAFARAAAAELVAERGVPQPAPGKHPDILFPEHPPENKVEQQKRDDGESYKAKRSIPIDEIRAMQQRLTTRPTLGGRRAVIIDPADDLEKNAVNALLKSLEEPPAGTFFLLVSHRPGRLLPTVRSRCRVLRFHPLPDETVEQILSREAPHADLATRAAAVAAARGSPGMALGFVEQDLAPVHRAMTRVLEAGDDHFEQRGALAEAIGARPDRERMQAVCDLARALVAGEVDAAPPQRQHKLIAAHAEIARLSGQVTTFNYDPALLIMEIGGLLASAALPRETA